MLLLIISSEPSNEEPVTKVVVKKGLIASSQSLAKKHALLKESRSPTKYSHDKELYLVIIIIYLSFYLSLYIIII